MVHADASNFAAGVSKSEAYTQIIEHAKALFDGQRNWICNTANAAALMWHALHALPPPSNRVNWAGFYVVNPAQKEQLILGPFQGKVACQTITFGRGVCGAAAASQQTQLVPNVEEFPGHIACDGESVSEIVVPIVHNGKVSGKAVILAWSSADIHAKVVAIIDLDCAVLNGFDAEDQRYLEELAQVIAEACDW